MIASFLRTRSGCRSAFFWNRQNDKGCTRLSVTDKEQEETKKEIQVSLYDDSCISLEEIFKDLFKKRQS